MPTAGVSVKSGLAHPSRMRRNGLSPNRFGTVENRKRRTALSVKQTYLCARMRRNNLPHDNTRALLEQWDSGGAVTGGDVSRIARNSHRKHKVLSSSRRSAFWPKPQKAPKTLFSLHPAASANESPAPHRVRQAAPSALSCRPVHARSPALSGRLLWAGAAS